MTTKNKRKTQTLRLPSIVIQTAQSLVRDDYPIEQVLFQGWYYGPTVLDQMPHLEHPGVDFQPCDVRRMPPGYPQADPAERARALWAGLLYLRVMANRAAAGAAQVDTTTTSTEGEQT